jgi:hypothetical protein
MKIKHLTTLFALLLAHLAPAQQELMLNSLPELWHSNTTNPAFFPEGKNIVVGLPSFGVDAAHSGDIRYRDFFRRENGRTVIDLSNAISKLDPENTLRFDQRLETVSLGIRLGKKRWGLRLGHAIAFSGQLQYPKALPELLWNGNGPFVGQTVEFAPQADVADWHEWSLGAMRRFGKLQLGLRAKWLTGISALRTDPQRSSMSLFTDPDIYQLTLNTDYAFHSAGIVSAIDTAGLGFDLSLDALNSQIRAKNNALVFDIGGVLTLSERLSLHASAQNLGAAIRWEQDAALFASKANYTYEGTNIPGADIINGTDSLDFDTKLDTLNDIFQFARSNSSFDTRTPLRLYAGASWKLSPRWVFGLNVFHQNHPSGNLTAVGASARWSPLRWLSLGAMYNLNDRSAANLGFHLAATPGPVQVYLMSDNMIRAVSLRNTPAFNLRFGLALAF